ncbi:UNKNOWN [Stylonychia lemnae]|uniref:Uncharacterized protein n=1 Tax=Stylonychia lemnae TaxID=5949 RepID=A0A078AXD9_STYLE|nr:UNKNOWN [Stylonychia lemnae]|eukprot:CDW87130.1 UNKNOWN [Stylonychia lemnae]
MRKSTLVLLFAVFAIFMISFTEASMIKAKTQAKAMDSKLQAKRDKIRAAQEQLKSFASREEAKAFAKNAVEQQHTEKAAARAAAKEGQKQ